MGQKKDIGTLFENKLNDGKKNPSNSLWEKINSSLDEEKRRKKRILFYWLVGGSLSVLLGIFFLFGNENSLQPTIQENSHPLIKQSNISSEKESKEASFEISKNDSLINKNYGEEKLSKIEISNESAEQNKTENLPKAESNRPQGDVKKQNKKTSLQDKSTDENFSVSKNYYYYNSSNGQQIVTTNKKEIDSLVNDTLFIKN